MPRALASYENLARYSIFAYEWGIFEQTGAPYLRTSL